MDVAKVGMAWPARTSDKSMQTCLQVVHVRNNHACSKIVSWNGWLGWF